MQFSNYLIDLHYRPSNRSSTEPRMFAPTARYDKINKLDSEQLMMNKIYLHRCSSLQSTRGSNRTGREWQVQPKIAMVTASHGYCAIHKIN